MTNPQQIIIKNQRSFPFMGILTLIFITLKLLGYITWSWWWVLSPIWLPFAIVFGIAGAFMLGALILGIIVAALEALGK